MYCLDKYIENEAILKDLLFFSNKIFYIFHKAHIGRNAQQ